MVMRPVSSALEADLRATVRKHDLPGLEEARRELVRAAQMGLAFGVQDTGADTEADTDSDEGVGEEDSGEGDTGGGEA